MDELFDGYGGVGIVLLMGKSQYGYCLSYRF